MNRTFLKCEVWFYHLFWIFSLAYGAYNVYGNSSSLKVKRRYEFTDGWKILDRMKDISDIDWTFYVSFLEKFGTCLLVHYIGSEIIRSLKPNLICFWYLVVTFCFCIYNFGVLPLMYILIHPLIIYVLCIPRSYKLIWLVTLCALFFPHSQLIASNFFVSSSANNYIFCNCICWGYLRSLSFAYYYITGFQTVSYANLLKFLSYYFYFPLFFYGPFITYEQYEEGLKNRDSPNFRKYTLLILSLFRYSFWFLFIEFCNHFIYASVFMSHAYLLAKFNSWSLYGTGFWVGQMFMVKYVVIYGLPGSIARHEGYDAPEHPKCISRIHLYSDMWRYFDKGLYTFILNYIYIPCSDANPTTWRKFLASFACFGLVFIWHGFYSHVLIWSVLNYIGVCLELLCKNLSNTHRYKHWEKKIFRNSHNIKRFYAIVSTPLFIMSVVSNFYFLGDADVGSLFVKRILNAPLMEKLILFFTCYCCCQVSMETKSREQIHSKQKEK